MSIMRSVVTAFRGLAEDLLRVGSHCWAIQRVHPPNDTSIQEKDLAEDTRLTEIHLNT